jgi:hypothetical protein
MAPSGSEARVQDAVAVRPHQQLDVLHLALRRRVEEREQRADLRRPPALLVEVHRRFEGERRGAVGREAVLASRCIDARRVPTRRCRSCRRRGPDDLLHRPARGMRFAAALSPWRLMMLVELALGLGEIPEARVADLAAALSFHSSTIASHDVETPRFMPAGGAHGLRPKRFAVKVGMMAAGDRQAASMPPPGRRGGSS